MVKKICDNCSHNIEYECMLSIRNLKVIPQKNKSDIAWEKGCDRWELAPEGHRNDWYSGCDEGPLTDEEVEQLGLPCPCMDCED